jgi:hypothetical protein
MLHPHRRVAHTNSPPTPTLNPHTHHLLPHSPPHTHHPLPHSPLIPTLITPSPFPVHASWWTARTVPWAARWATGAHGTGRVEDPPAVTIRMRSRSARVRSSRTRCTVALRARVWRTSPTARMSALRAQVEHPLYTVHCTHCTLYLPYTVLTIHCTVLNIHCTVLTAQAPGGTAVDLRVSPRAPTLGPCARESVFRSVSALILLRTGTYTRGRRGRRRRGGWTEQLCAWQQWRRG